MGKFTFYTGENGYNSISSTSQDYEWEIMKTNTTSSGMYATLTTASEDSFFVTPSYYTYPSYTQYRERWEKELLRWATINANPFKFKPRLNSNIKVL